jgi:hypothetical protein
MRNRRRKLIYVTKSGIYVSRRGWSYLIVSLLLLSVVITALFTTATLHHHRLVGPNSQLSWWQSETTPR